MIEYAYEKPPPSLDQTALPASHHPFAHYTMDHPLNFDPVPDDDYIWYYIDNLSSSPTSPTDYSSIRDSHVLPPSTSTWSVGSGDNPPSTVTVAADPQQIEVIRIVESESKLAVGQIIRPLGKKRYLEIKEMIGWERHAVCFYCQDVDTRRDALLIVRNERVEWGWWSTVGWFLTFPFLQRRMFLAESPV